MPTIKLTKLELQALIQRSSRGTGVQDSKLFMRVYDKLMKAWCELRDAERKAKASCPK